MNTEHIDKNSIKHFTLSYVIALYSTEASVSAGITKEWCDKNSYGHWCYWDLFFNSLGTILGTLTRIALIKLTLGEWIYNWY